jgi:hypothetical protein
MFAFRAPDTLVLDPPPGTAAGAYACGTIGELVDGPAEVTLHAPPPLRVPLAVDFLPDGTIDVHDGDTLVLSARPVDGVDVELPVRHGGVTRFPVASVPNRDGVVAAAMVWAALVRAWERPGVLARLAVERLDVVEVEEPVIATGWHVGEHHTASALLSPDGDVLARASARWISPRSPR